MKRIVSILVCLLIMVSCVLPARASAGVPQEVMEATKSVVRILAEHKRNSVTGSGFVIKNEPGEVLIATNDHVVADDPKSIRIWVGEDRQVDAEIVFTTAAKDLCVLRVTEPVDMAPLTLSEEEAQHGAAIYAVGYPGAGDVLSDTQAHTSDSVTITDGIISAIRTFTIEEGAQPVKLLQVNAAINAGNSGGPLFNTKGEVIGVNTYKVNVDSQGVFGSVDISELWKLLDEHGIVLVEEVPETEPLPTEETIPVEEPAAVPVAGIAVGGAVAVLALVLLVAVIAKKKKKVTLAAYMARYPQGMAVNEAVSMLLPVAIQLRNSHNDGKLHLQLCPENILIGRNGASVRESGNQETGRYNSGFAAPEVYKGAGFGVASDIYSFAAVLLYAVIGRVPGNSLQNDAVLQDIASLEDAAFAEVIRKAMAFQIPDRTQSMQELISAIAVYNIAVQKQQPQREAPQKAAAPDLPMEAPKTAAAAEPYREEKTESPNPSKKKKSRLLPVAAVLACAVAAVFLLWKFKGMPGVVPEATEMLQQEETTVPMTPEEMAYAEAEAWEADGQLGRAAIAFGKLGDYQDARERSFALWDQITQRDTIAVGNYHTLAIKSDGTVLATGSNIVSENGVTHKPEYGNSEEDPCAVGDWSGIVAVCATTGGSVGLRSDGTVVTTLSRFKETVSQWRDVVSIGLSNGTYGIYGLKMDGTVVTTNTAMDVSDYTDIVSLLKLKGNDLLGIKADGTFIMSTLYEYPDWMNAEVCSNLVDFCRDFNMQYNVEIALKADGTVMVTGSDKKVEDVVRTWEEIVQIDIGGPYLTALGLKRDGSVVMAGKSASWYDLTEWTDIVAIAASDLHAVGLKSDGTMVATGNIGYGKCDVSDWTDIKLPTKTLPARNGNETKPKEVPADQQAQYEAAEDLLAKGETAKAAIAFGKLGDFKNAWERSFALWRKITPCQTLSAAYHITSALKEDGTVLITGSGDARQMAAKKWTDVVSVSISSDHTVGLKADGTVLAAGANFHGQCDLSDWKDIIQVGAKHNTTIGLKSDGTVVAVGYSENGQLNVTDWTDIVAISASAHTVGLKMDGTVVAVGAEGFDYGQLNVDDWTDIVAISAGNTHTVGLKSDGTVVAAGAEYDNGTYECVTDVADWSDIVAITAGSNFTAGLKSDGTVVFAGSDFDNNYEVSGWSDIVSIASGPFQLLGLKSDGTLVITGINKGKGEFNVTNWTDIKLPN